MAWGRLKAVFLKQYYPRAEQLRKQQEFTHLIQGGQSMERYDRESMLKRFAASSVDVEQKMTKNP